MDRPNRGTYNKHASVANQFYHSCLGKITLMFAAFGVLALIAMVTRPSDERMESESIDNIKECIAENDSIQGDHIDDAVGNAIHVFTSANDAAIKADVLEAFNKYNQLKVYHHTLYKTAYIHNNFRPQGSRVSIGILGVVIPTVNFEDILLQANRIRGDMPDIKPVIMYNEDSLEDALLKMYKSRQ